MKIELAFTLFLTLLLSMSSSTIQPVELNTSGQVMHDFEFTLMNSTIVELSDYTDKPVLVHWVASWCSTCRQNQGHINTIYDTYKDQVNFLSISFGGSGDAIEDLNKLEVNNRWDIGLDHTNYAATVGKRNSHMWILNTDMTLFVNWGAGIHSPNKIAEELNKLLEIDEDPDFGSDTLLPLQGNLLLIGFSIIIVIALAVLTAKRYNLF
jgi:thiol-disulfide isomerase/thioredoxin